MRCREHNIEHRFTKINHPWTNGKVERMNRTIKEATAKRYHSETHNKLQKQLANFVDAYKFGRRLKALKASRLRIHLQKLDKRRATIYLEPAVPNART